MNPIDLNHNMDNKIDMTNSTNNEIIQYIPEYDNYQYMNIIDIKKPILTTNEFAQQMHFDVTNLYINQIWNLMNTYEHNIKFKITDELIAMFEYNGDIIIQRKCLKRSIKKYLLENTDYYIEQDISGALIGAPLLIK